jgi:hypothetical protein
VNGNVRTDQEIVQEALAKYAQTSGAPSRGDALTALGRLGIALHTAIRERDEAREETRRVIREDGVVVSRQAARLERVEAAAMALYERVEMDESVGICLSSRVEALNLAAALSDVTPPLSEP